MAFGCVFSGEWNNEAAQISGPFHHLFVLAAAGTEGRLLRFSAGFRPQDDVAATLLFEQPLGEGLAPAHVRRMIDGGFFELAYLTATEDRETVAAMQPVIEVLANCSDANVACAANTFIAGLVKD